VSENEQGASKLGFLDSIAKLFRRREEAPASRAEGPGRWEKLDAEFDTAIRGLNQKIEEGRRSSAATEFGAEPSAQTAEEREAARKQRREAAHRAMREDIGKAHAALGTGLSGGDLEALARYVEELQGVTAPGRQSHSLLPRARYAIGEKLRREAGTLAATRLVALLEREKRTWPDPTHYNPSATQEEIERSRRRRLAETREAFLAEDLQKTSERLLGIVRGWGADYPDRGSPLWEECVLEGVGAGLRGQLLKDFVEVLRRDRDLLLDRVEASIGKELAALQGVLAGGVRSLEQASQAVESSLRVLDEMVPEIAWEEIRARSPRARGEFAS
jgi:hypothetical protein